MQIQSDGNFDAASQSMPTLEDQLNAVGLGSLQWRVVFAAGIMVVGDGMELAAVSMLKRPLAREWGVSSDELALIGSVLFCGTIFGSVWGGWCSDQMGRRWTLSSFGLLFVFGGICSAASQSFPVFAVARFVSPFFFVQCVISDSDPWIKLCYWDGNRRCARLGYKSDGRAISDYA